jgi:hypothetical protein
VVGVAGMMEVVVVVVVVAVAVVVAVLCFSHFALHLVL